MQSQGEGKKQKQKKNMQSYVLELCLPQWPHATSPHFYNVHPAA